MNKYIFAIDPGNVKSAYVIINDETHKVVEHHNGIDNALLVDRIRRISKDQIEKITFVIEMVASYGMPVGKTIFDTVIFIGELKTELRNRKAFVKFVTRKEVKLSICNSVRAKDGNVREALLSKYPSTGAGKVPQVGTKKRKGPLYGIAKDGWAALGVAHAALDKSVKYYKFDY